jgi:hypothetical protein
MLDVLAAENSALLSSVSKVRSDVIFPPNDINHGGSGGSGVNDAAVGNLSPTRPSSVSDVLAAENSALLSSISKVRSDVIFPPNDTNHGGSGGGGANDAGIPVGKLSPTRPSSVSDVLAAENSALLSSISKIRSDVEKLDIRGLELSRQ